MDRIAKPYYLLRIFLHKRRWLLRAAQIVRGLVILGPFRSLAIRYFQWRNTAQPMRMDRRDLFPTGEVQPVVDALNATGYANGWKIPDEHVTQIIRYCEHIV